MNKIKKMDFRFGLCTYIHWAKCSSHCLKTCLGQSWHHRDKQEEALFISRGIKLFSDFPHTKKKSFQLLKLHSYINFEVLPESRAGS